MLHISRKINKWTAKIFDLPPDVVFDLPRMTMIGNRQLYIENHQGVIHFASDLLRLNVMKGEMEIRGRQLVIREILPEEIMIEGIVEQIRHIEKQEGSV